MPDGAGSSVDPRAAHAASTAQSRMLMGTAHPFTLVRADTHRSWIVLCQAREDTNGDGMIQVEYAHHGAPFGDQMRTYFIQGQGPGTPIDRFIGSDPTGRYLVMEEHGKFVLRDTREGRVRDFSAWGLDFERDPSPATGPRTAQFGARGKYLLLLRAQAPGQSARITLLGLADQSVRELDAGPGRVWHAGLSPTDDWVFTRVVTRDSNGNGKLDLPEVQTTLDDAPCGSPASYSTFGLREGHDEIEVRILPVEGGAARPATGFIAFMGKKLLRRLPDKSVVLEDAAGRRQELVPATCRGPVVEANSTFDAVLAACGVDDLPRMGDGASEGSLSDKVRLHAFAIGRHRDLGIAPDPWAGEVDRTCDTRFIPLVTGRNTTYIFDFQTLVPHPLPPGELCASHEGRALFRNASRETWLFDINGSSPRKITDEGCYSGGSNGRWSLIGNELFDFDAKAIVGRFPRAAKTLQHDFLRMGGLISADGRVLLAVDHDAETPAHDELVRRMKQSVLAEDSMEIAPRGPLEWVEPEPVSPHASGKP